MQANLYVLRPTKEGTVGLRRKQMNLCVIQRKQYFNNSSVQRSTENPCTFSTYLKTINTVIFVATAFWEGVATMSPFCQYGQYGQYKMQTADCRLQTGYKMQTRYKMQTADCRLGTKCRLRINK